MASLYDTTTWNAWSHGTCYMEVDTSSTASTTTWGTWCVSSGTSSATTTDSDGCWTSWSIRRCGDTSAYARTQASRFTETPEQVAARAEREAAWQAEAAKRREAEAEAERRAAELLKSTLDEEQKQQLEQTRMFRLVGADGVRYEIDVRKKTHNVFELDESGKRVVEMCAYQTGDTPLSDNALAQKLALETDPAAFKRVANKWELRSGYRRTVAG